jgi:hypothetical protein
VDHHVLGDFVPFLTAAPALRGRPHENNVTGKRVEMKRHWDRKIVATFGTIHGKLY